MDAEIGRRGIIIILDVPCFGDGLRAGNDMVERRDVREPPMASEVHPQTEVRFQGGEFFDVLLPEITRHAETFIPAENGHHFGHAGVVGRTGGADALKRHRSIDAKVFGGEIFHFIWKLRVVVGGEADGRPPAELRLDEIRLAEVLRQRDMRVMVAAGGVARMVPCAEPRMEPPAVVPPAAGLRDGGAFELLVDFPTHCVDAVAAAHAFGPVEIDAVQSGGVIDVGDGVGEIFGQLAVRIRIEGDVALLQVVRLVALRMGGDFRAEGAARAFFEGVGRLTGDFRILDDFLSDLDGVAVGGIAPDDFMSGHGLFIDVELRIRFGERPRERVGGAGDQIVRRDGRHPWIARIDAGRQRVEGGEHARLMDFVHGLFHIIQSIGEQ